MSVFEHARRLEMQERREAAMDRLIEQILGRPTPPMNGPDAVEEIAEILVRAAVALREAAALSREAERRAVA